MNRKNKLNYNNSVLGIKSLANIPFNETIIPLAPVGGGNMPLFVEMLIILARGWLRILLAQKEIGQSILLFHGSVRKRHASFQVG